MDAPFQNQFATGTPTQLLRASRGLRIAALKAPPAFLTELSGHIIATVEQRESTANTLQTPKKGCIGNQFGAHLRLRRLQRLQVAATPTLVRRMLAIDNRTLSLASAVLRNMPAPERDRRGEGSRNAPDIA